MMQKLFGRRLRLERRNGCLNAVLAQTRNQLGQTVVDARTIHAARLVIVPEHKHGALGFLIGHANVGLK